MRAFPPYEFSRSQITERARSVTARRANVPHAVGLILPPNQWLLPLVPHSHEGRFAIVTDVERGMRWTR
jgi:hypothetical protein